MIRTIAIALLLTGAPAALAPAPLAARETVATAPTAWADRQDAGTVSLRWQGLRGPVSIHRLDRPDARPMGAPLVAAAAGEAAVVPAAAWPRPYFLLRDAGGRTLVTAERVLPLAGGNNFRDLGGYRTADGRRAVQWGQLYRSGVMADLTPDDFGHMGRLGIATVCDFRATDERGREPVNWPEGVQPTVLTTDYGLDMGALRSLFQGGPVTGESTAAAMAGFYRDTPFTFAGQYARMMRELVEGRAPLAFNCSAGKDRTGVAAALLLTALGVDRETAIQDYLLSNRYFKAEMPKGVGEDPTAKLLAGLPPEALRALMGVDRRYLEASFAAIDEKGGMDRYLAEQLKLSPADLATLRKRYLVPAT